MKLTVLLSVIATISAIMTSGDPAKCVQVKRGKGNGQGCVLKNTDTECHCPMPELKKLV